MTPFYLDDEYEQIERVDYDNNITSYKKWLNLIIFLFILRVFVFIFDNQSVSFYYQSAFLIYIIIVSDYKLKHRQLLLNKVLMILVINYVIAFCFSYFPFYLSVLLEIITFLISVDIIRDKSFILKGIEYLNIYKIVIMIIAIYASLVYKI